MVPLLHQVVTEEGGGHKSARIYRKETMSAEDDEAAGDRGVRFERASIRPGETTRMSIIRDDAEGECGDPLSSFNFSSLSCDLLSCSFCPLVPATMSISQVKTLIDTSMNAVAANLSQEISQNLKVRKAPPGHPLPRTYAPCVLFPHRKLPIASPENCRT